MVDEAGLVAALKSALAPTPVYWGWAPAEGAELPPSLPLVTVHRSLYTTAPYDDLCVDDPPVGDTTLVVHAWSDVYAVARALTTQARQAIVAAGGWTLQSEIDLFDQNVRAWCVEAQWFAGGVAPD